MNHVPDEILDAVDTFSEALLTGSPPPFRGRLRSDLQVSVRPAGDGQTALCRYETEHAQAPPTLRDRGSYVTTVVDGIDARFRVWGIDPPEAYEYSDTVDGFHRYEGTLRLP